MKNKVMIVDDHFVVREGLKLILESDDSFQIIGEAENGKVALELLTGIQPDVILMDLNMPIRSGLETIKALNDQNNSIPIIILTTYNEDELMVEGIGLGAKGYLLKDASRDHLFRTINAAIRGETLLQPEIMNRLLAFNKKSVAKTSQPNKAMLTPKELIILHALARGTKTKNIASDMNIAERTVKAHLTTIYNKLGVNSRTEAVVIALTKGYIEFGIE